VMEMAQVRIPSDRPPTPPGEMLLEEFIRPLGMTQAELADRIGVSYVRLNEIVNGRRGITPSTALRLAKALGTTPQFWLNGQLALDLYRVSHDPAGHNGWSRTNVHRGEQCPAALESVFGATPQSSNLLSSAIVNRHDAGPASRVLLIAGLDVAGT
jgi:antitoxin HigA-1